MKTQSRRTHRGKKRQRDETKAQHSKLLSAGHRRAEKQKHKEGRLTQNKPNTNTFSHSRDERPEKHRRKNVAGCSNQRGVKHAISISSPTQASEAESGNYYGQ
ncbi:uncharacterized protein LOC129310383 [Prosopis cineraria]|uniref:uncharacterized protein LOC129310383 n=1 Tax=Prosopis cineraria TaxID=364024 RepID=UPI0024104CD3|nr:uncharacterized protein LOC129310383 [Prosopis cineraria]